MCAALGLSGLVAACASANDSATTASESGASDAAASDARVSNAVSDAGTNDTSSDATCHPGDACGAECDLPSEAPCMMCGTLYFTSDCACRPRTTPGAGFCFWPDCSDPGPAPLGGYCGQSWWCDRPCASGLSCLDEPAMPDADGGMDSRQFITTCQLPPDDAGDVGADAGDGG